MAWLIGNSLNKWHSINLTTIVTKNIYFSILFYWIWFPVSLPLIQWLLIVFLSYSNFCEYLMKILYILNNLEWYIVGFAKSWVERILSKLKLYGEEVSRHVSSVNCSTFSCNFLFLFVSNQHNQEGKGGRESDCSFIYLCLLT